MIHAVRLNVIDSWQRCPCGKLRVVLVGSVGESPADLHYCLSCDAQPESVWDRQLVHSGQQAIDVAQRLASAEHDTG